MAKMTPLCIICPVCQAEILVPVEIAIVDSDLAYLGMATLTFDPDMTPLTAHMFAHQLDAPDAIESLRE